MECTNGFECLGENLQAVNSSDHNRRRQIERIMEALNGSHRMGLQEDAVGHALHSQDPDVTANQLGQDLLLKAPIVSIHQVEGHLDRVDFESAAFRDIQRVSMYRRIFVAGEPDVAKLAGIASREERRVRTMFIKDPMRVLESNHLMMLDQIDAVDLKAPQGLLELPSRFFR